MKYVMKLFALLGKALFGRLPFCSLPGAAVGAFAGFVFGIVMIQAPTLKFTNVQLALIGTILGFVGFLCILVLLGLWLHYGISSIAFPALVNAILTGIAAVIVANAIHNSALSALMGFIVGILVGALLCASCRWARWEVGGSHGQ
jgi:hypothetical protein